MDQGVVTFGQLPEKPAHGADSVAARAQKENAVPLQFLPILDARGGNEIPQQFGPIAAIGLAKQFHQSLALAAGGSLLESHLEQDGVPPADLVVRVIADDSRVVAQSPNLFARDLFHPSHDLWVPHVPPRCAGRGPDVQHGRERHIRVLAFFQGLEIAPPANRGEAPGLEALQRRLGPLV